LVRERGNEGGVRGKRYIGPPLLFGGGGGGKRGKRLRSVQWTLPRTNINPREGTFNTGTVLFKRGEIPRGRRGGERQMDQAKFL